MKRELAGLIRTASKLDLALGPGVTPTDQERQRRSATAILERMFGASPVPGVILGDEVGMGKTYVALAVAAAHLHQHPTGRILVLAHSRAMARTWKDRWDCLRQTRANQKLDLPEGSLIPDLNELDGGISFAAYDTLKHVSSAELKATLREVLHCKGAPRSWLRQRLINELFPRCRRLTNEYSPDVFIRDSEKRAFWSHFMDWERGCWKSQAGVRREFKRLYFSGAVRRKHRIGLLIIDEAHKLAGDGRGSFFDCVLGERAKKAMLVTATPFSLDIAEFRERVRDLFSLCGVDDTPVAGDHAPLWKQMREYRDAVRRRDPRFSQSQREGLERELGRYFVRSTQKRNRKSSNLAALVARTPATAIQRFATLALEGEFSDLYRNGGATQIASRRQTLCSSFSAAMESEEERDPEGSRLSRLLGRALRSSQEHPKLETCVSWVRDSLPLRQKLVIFCSRLATIRTLRSRLSELYADEAHRTARKWGSFRKRLLDEGYDSLQIAKLRMAFAHNMEDTRVDISRALKQCDREAAGPDDPLWLEAWGARHRMPWVETLTGNRDEGYEGRSNEAVRFAFNLPGPPYILISSSVGREGIDLHRHCRRLMHYDLEWSPTAMEQRVGRVDRIGSLARREKKPIEIHYLMTPGSYEERIFGVVMERMSLVRALLGAGEWLRSNDLSRQFAASAAGATVESEPDLARFRLNFAP